MIDVNRFLADEGQSPTHAVRESREVAHTCEQKPIARRILAKQKKLRARAAREFGAPSRTPAGHSLQSFPGLNYYLPVTITI
jgi:hypothetical protein